MSMLTKPGKGAIELNWNGKIHDISMEISESMMVYKNKQENRPVIKVTRDFDGGAVYETTMTIGMHTGTHLDMPLHMIKGGRTLDDLSLNQVVTPCRVLDFSDVEEGIDESLLQGRNIQKDEFVLLKTRNSDSDDFDFSFVYLTASGASYLKDKGVKGIGIDALSVERSQPGHQTHGILLNSEIMIIEGLRLKHIPEGEYFLIAAPLKIKGAEASPLRALLLEQEG
jgi:arylformamidase